MNEEIIKKIHEDLEKAQGRDRARLLTPNDIISRIELFTKGDYKKLIDLLNNYGLEYALQYQQGDSKKGYQYVNTGFTAFFNNNCEVIEIFIYRYKNSRNKFNIYIVGYDYLTSSSKRIIEKGLKLRGYNINHKGEIEL